MIEHPAEPLPPPKPPRVAVASAPVVPKQPQSDAPVAARPVPTADLSDIDADFASAEPAVWPSEEAEVLARSDAAERGESLKTSQPAGEDDEPEKATLPDLNQLVERIPTPVKETLEELFRAKWTRVTRIKKRDLVS